MSISPKNRLGTPDSSPYKPPRLTTPKAVTVASRALTPSGTSKSKHKPLKERSFCLRAPASAPASLKKSSREASTPSTPSQPKDSIPIVAFPDLGPPKLLTPSALLPLTPSTPNSKPKARRAKLRALKVIHPETPKRVQPGLTFASTPARVREIVTKHPALAPSTPLPTSILSPKVKLGKWRVHRTPRGTVHASPPMELRPAMRKVDQAVYSIERISPGGTVKSTYGGSVARSHPDVKSKNNVVRRFQTYSREANNPKKNRPVIQEMRSYSEECFVTIYRSVGGDINELHKQEARHIRHVKSKHPFARNLNVSDPKKEPDLTGPRPHLRGRRRKKNIKK